MDDIRSFDILIIGSGPAGVFSALGLQGVGNLKVGILDVGHHAPNEATKLRGNAIELRRSAEDLFTPMIGDNFESFHNLHKRKISLKLKAPFTEFIVRDWQRLSPLLNPDFEGMVSFAKGGFSNAWGAGVYRFTDAELSEFPFTSRELHECYDIVSDEVGVSGDYDDLQSDFGPEPRLLPPLHLSRMAEKLLRAYHKRKPAFSKAGIRLGRPRLAVITDSLAGRDRYNYENLEFFKAHGTSVYNSATTLERLIRDRAVTYLPGFYAERFHNHADHVEVSALNLQTQTRQNFRARHLLCAAGALNSSKLVLQTSDDYSTRLPILDNPMSCVPLFSLSEIGKGMDPFDSSLGQLNLIYQGPLAASAVQATLYNTTGPLRSDILFDLPLPFRTSLHASRSLAAAMSLLMLFYAGETHTEHSFRLDASGALDIHYHAPALGAVERHLIRSFCRAGFLSTTSLCMYPKVGNSLHYAGLLPMRRDPGPYQTDPNGRLYGSPRVRIVDSAIFPTLPAKNLTYTIMANALRIARHLRQELLQ